MSAFGYLKEVGKHGRRCVEGRIQDGSRRIRNAYSVP